MSKLRVNAFSLARFLICLAPITLSAFGGGHQAGTTAIHGCSTPAASAAADALAAKFDDHQFVFIGSTHGDAKSEEFLACLVTRPAFQMRVTDIVSEWASSGQQQLLDRYLLLMESLAADGLAPIFLDTDSPSLWTTLRPIRQTLETLRDVNGKREPKKRIRVIGGNEGIDWARITAPEDFAQYPYKTNLMPHLILEHLARTPGNRTLVVYGDALIRHQGKNFMAEIEDALGRRKLFVVGTVRELKENEREYLAAMGDPAKPFFADARRFPAKHPWPDSLRTSLEEQQSQPLAHYIDGLLYLGPDADRDLTGSIPLSETQKRELERRNSFRSDPRRVMRARSSGRDQWFRAHPNDLPPRPQ